jgi:hypothetical protein
MAFEGSLYNLKGFDSVFDSMLNNELQDNIIEFLDFSLLQKGNYFNVTLSESSPRGNDYSRLRLSSNDQYTAGQAWEGFRSNWVWQSGINYSPAPITGTDNANPGISGVYVNSVFHPTSGVGTYAHNIDYLNGRVIFNSPIPTGSTVQAEFSYKWINVVYANSVPWLREIQYRSYEPNSEFLSTTGGSWDKPPEMRLQMPAIAVEIVPKRKMTGYQIGGGQWIVTDVLFHCIAEDEMTRNKLVDIVSLQNDKTIYMFNSNAISSSGDFPLDHLGVPVSGAMRYPELISNHYSNRLRLKNSSVQGMEMINSNLYGGVVKLSTEVVDTKI